MQRGHLHFDGELSPARRLPGGGGHTLLLHESLRSRVRSSSEQKLLQPRAAFRHISKTRLKKRELRGACHVVFFIRDRKAVGDFFLLLDLLLRGETG